MSDKLTEKNNTDIHKKFISTSEKRILHKLVQAIIREGAAVSQWIPYGEFGGIYRLQTHQLHSSIHIHINKKYLLGHIDIDQVIHIQEGSKKEVTHPVEFLQALFQETDEVLQLMEEINDSVRNDALALTAAERKKVRFHYDKGLFNALLHQKNSVPAFSPLVFLEQSVIEGHTLHPCSKTRMGLSIEENQKYAPEWEAEVELKVLALHKDIVNTTSMSKKTMTDLLLSDYPDMVNDKNYDCTSYELIPVHPWQFEHVIEKHFYSDLSDGNITVLNQGIMVKPLMSFRSMAPEKGTKLHHIKTAVNIQMTSAKRLVSPASVHNGPVVSMLLKKVEQDDPFISGKAIFLAEVAGSHYSGSVQSDEIVPEKNLSCLIRENPEAYLAQGELAVPAASLINRIPSSKKIVLKELIESFSETRKLTLEEGAAEFLGHYTKVLMPVLMHLLIKYGISLEAHLQNTIIIFKEGIPVKLMVRDNGGVRIHKQLSAEWMDVNKINDSTNLLTNDTRDLYQMFSHAVIHNHLGEMIVGLARENGIKEKVLWDKVKAVVCSYLTEIRVEERLQGRIAELEDHLFAPFTYLKALVKMRLSDSFTEGVYVNAGNPLHPLNKGGNIL
ncbi:IucA/IucC family protein [Bacillus sp. SG-1]|uniref:IucA/IucC family protein n=1 Tax=Bacillus sp. SG-1 TaxID=161544 RepID=UPI00015437B8|nr:IucA/IucC family protein [Bacillus sp. SG-1]EDL66719.1 hypothetical protein BSG1_05165 [Bacillus sp. SG-1]